MAWTWVKQGSPDVLAGRPLLDLGCGDAQTLAALVESRGLVVGCDRSLDGLRAARRTVRCSFVGGDAAQIPFRDATFDTVLAADLFHHLTDEALAVTLREIRRTLSPGGTLVAWWYDRPGRPAPDSPRFPRSYEDVAEAGRRAGFEVDRLALHYELDPAPSTAGFRARAPEQSA